MKHIEICNEQEAEIDHALLNGLLGRVLNWAPGQNGYTARIHIQPPLKDPEGWVEYLAVIQKDGTRNFTLAGIRRSPDSSMEFHS